MDEKELLPDGTEKPREKKYPRDDVPIGRWGFRITGVCLLLWAVCVFLPGGKGLITIVWIFPLFVLYGAFLLASIRGMHKLAELHASYSSTTVLRELKEDFPNTLARLHLQWVGDYYAETKTQARNSFRLTVVAATLSLIVVGTGIEFLYVGKIEVGKVTAAAGVIQGLISAVFFHLHTKTVTKMADYHRKLILTQNISLALKAADDLQEPARAKVKSAVIRALTKDVSNGFIPDRPTSVRPRTPSANGVPAAA